MMCTQCYEVAVIKFQVGTKFQRSDVMHRYSADGCPVFALTNPAKIIVTFQNIRSFFLPVVRTSEYIFGCTESLFVIFSAVVRRFVRTDFTHAVNFIAVLTRFHHNYLLKQNAVRYGRHSEKELFWISQSGSVFHSLIAMIPVYHNKTGHTRSQRVSFSIALRCLRLIVSGLQFINSAVDSVV